MISANGSNLKLDEKGFSVTTSPARVLGRIARNVIAIASLSLLGGAGCFAQEKDGAGYTKDGFLHAIHSLIRDWSLVDMRKISDGFGVELKERSRNVVGGSEFLKFQNSPGSGFLYLKVTGRATSSDADQIEPVYFDVSLFRRSMVEGKPNPLCITRQDVIQVFGDDWIGTTVKLPHGARIVGAIDEINAFKFYGMEYLRARNKSGTLGIASFRFGHHEKCLGGVEFPIASSAAATENKPKQ